jgi:hypothetical protein
MTNYLSRLTENERAKLRVFFTLNPEDDAAYLFHDGSVEGKEWANGLQSRTSQLVSIHTRGVPMLVYRKAFAKLIPCGNLDCCISSHISDQLTFGSGELDENGAWEHPCRPCAAAAEARDKAKGLDKEHPDWFPYWPTH